MGWNTSCSNKLFILVKCFNFWHHYFILPLLMSCPGVNDIPTIQIDHTSHSCPSCPDIITLQTTSVLFHPDIINRIYVCNWCTSTMVCLWSLIMIVLGECPFPGVRRYLKVMRQYNWSKDLICTFLFFQRCFFHVRVIFYSM